MLSEADVQQILRITAPKYSNMLLRNNSGAMQDDTGRVVRFGLGNDSARLNKVFKSSDLIGLTQLVIQPHHVGQCVGVFTAVECKALGWKGPHPSNEREQAQLNFINSVIAHGGYAGFATCVEDYNRIIGL